MKLILDDEALNLIAAKLPGHPVIVGDDGGLIEAGVLEPTDDDVVEKWQPGNELAKRMVLACEACQDISVEAEYFILNEAQRKRSAKRLTVPTCALMDMLVSLLAMYNSPVLRQEREGWPICDQRTYRQLAARIKKTHCNGSVRRVRNKVGAHLDPAGIGDPGIRLPVDDLLSALGDSLVVLGLMQNVSARNYAWIRGLGWSASKSGYLVETMFDYPATTCLLTDEQGKVKDLVAVRIAADPRHEIARPVHMAIGSYNAVVKAVRSRLPLIWMAETQQLLEAEAKTEASESAAGLVHPGAGSAP